MGMEPANPTSITVAQRLPAVGGRAAVHRRDLHILHFVKYSTCIEAMLARSRLGVCGILWCQTVCLFQQLTLFLFFFFFFFFFPYDAVACTHA